MLKRAKLVADLTALVQDAKSVSFLEVPQTALKNLPLPRRAEEPGQNHGRRRRERVSLVGIGPKQQKFPPISTVARRDPRDA
jgi:hypothetical protein